MRVRVIGIFTLAFALSSCETVQQALSEFGGALQTAAEQISQSISTTEWAAASPRPEGAPGEFPPGEHDALPAAWSNLRVDTAADVDYLSMNEKQVVLELNKARTNPAAYAKEYLVPMRSFYRGTLLSYPGQVAITTNEGLAALEECINVMIAARPMPALDPKKGLSSAARDHVVDQGQTGAVGHSGGDGSDPGKRIERYGRWSTTWGENIDYGYQSPRMIVTSLLIDDGVPSRGLRSNIMNARFRCVGLAVGRHPEYCYMCTMDFAGDYL
jgi:uncharacterized protein YkwD